jgi:hypothetical protein
LRYVLQDKPISYTSLTNSGVTYTTSLEDFLTKINSNQFGEESIGLSGTGVIYYEGIRPYLYFSYQRTSDDDFPFEIGKKIKANELGEAVITEVSIISSKTEEFTEDELT